MYHDVEIQDEAGRKLAARRLPEGAAGVTGLHELIAAHLGEDGDPGQVVVAIETDRGLWVQALTAAGYQVYGLNPKQVARFKERYNLSGKKDDAADAHALADMVRAERHQLRAVAADTAAGQAIKVVARAHQTLIWERTRHTLRLRSALREFFPAALLAYADRLPRRALPLSGPPGAGRATAPSVTTDRGSAHNGTATGDSGLNPVALPPTVAPMWAEARKAARASPSPVAATSSARRP
jgi:transposase